MADDGERSVWDDGAPDEGDECGECAGAVVEGELRADGVFEASQVIVKHDENYVAPSQGGLPTQGFDPGS